MNDSLETSAVLSPWKRVWPFVKWSLFALFLAFVVWRIRGLWNEGDETFADVSIRWGWLPAAATAYVVGWWPSIWFWRMMLIRLGGDVPVTAAARAYYCGHLGKYIPGKALVLVIRAGLVSGRGARPAAAALTAAYETLAMMSVGVALGVALAPSVTDVGLWEHATGLLGTWWSWTWFRWMWTTPGMLPVVIFAISCALLPLLARLASIAAVKMVPDELEGTGTGRALRVIDTRLFATGMLVLIAAWWVHGLSLGCVVAALSGEPFDLTNWPAWTAAASLATSLGFLAIFAPGGAGVREWVLIEVLRVQPGITPQVAVAAALLLRVVWLVTELVVAGGLYWLFRDARVEVSP